jgi:hypothetical protein
MVYLTNAFSLGMVNGDCTLKVSEISVDQVKKLLTSSSFISAVGHQSTADYIRAVTNVNVTCNRVAISLAAGDKLLVLQLLSRLPEGVVLTQDEVAKVPSKWYLVTVV